jgi:putative ABC transport system permease protein
VLKSYLLTAFRSIKKSALYTIIKVLGLAVGMMCVILTMLYIQNEFSYDRYHANANNIFRLTTKSDRPGFSIHTIFSWGELGPLLSAKFPEVMKAVRMYVPREFVVEYGSNRLITDPVYADPDILSVFSFPLYRGDAKSALRDPSDVLITQAFAKRLFRDGDPLNQVISVYDLDGKYDLKVVGILKDIPKNSHFRFDFLASLEHYRNRPTERVSARFNCITYLLLRNPKDAQALQKKIPELLRQNFGERAAGRSIFLQPLTSIHLGSHLALELEENSSSSISFLLSLISVIVLLIACINFINLSIAYATRRAREVGVRKAIGASKSQLVSQFMAESFLLSIMALFVAIFISYLLLPIFNSLMNRQLAISFFKAPFLYFGLIAVALLVGIVAGYYPAIFLSSFSSSTVLKGNILKGGKTSFLARKGLIIVQYAVSLVLIIGALVISSQFRYIKHKALGVKNNNVLAIAIFKDGGLQKKVDLIKQELGSVPGVVDIAISEGTFGSYNGFPINCIPQGFPTDPPIQLHVLPTGLNYFRFFGVDIISGRDFQKEIGSDAGSSIIINETATRFLNWSNPVGKQISSAFFSEDRMKQIPMTVVGVVRDYHNGSLHDAIQPTIYWLNPDAFNEVYIRFRPDHISDTLLGLEKKWKILPTHLPFSYTFLDDSLGMHSYIQDRQLSKLFNSCSLLALALSVIGIFGLMSFATERRRKEIAIRKVSGASTPAIVALLIREFFVLVIAANILAWPIAFYISRRWLNTFAYRTALSWEPFIMSGVGVLAIMLLTTISKSCKAANANPVDALKYE